MSVVKTVVCLANSRKLSGRCVAGKELISDEVGPWIRPVSDRPSEEVSEYERQYEDGSDPQVLDIIQIPLLRPHVKAHQPENWLLDPEYYWSRVRRATWQDLAQLVDHPSVLWLNTSSTYHGINDRVAVEDLDQLDCSLYLLQLDGLTLRVFAPGRDFGNPKRRVQASFTYRGQRYALRVTDPVAERDYLARDDGVFTIGPCFITVSLGEPYEGYCYKLVATIITPDRAAS